MSIEEAPALEAEGQRDELHSAYPQHIYTHISWTALIRDENGVIYM